MSKEPQIQENEVKTKVTKRVPPGDRWSPLQVVEIFQTQP